jgi:hypothetical protein
MNHEVIAVDQTVAGGRFHGTLELHERVGLNQRTVETTVSVLPPSTWKTPCAFTFFVKWMNTVAA